MRNYSAAKAKKSVTSRSKWASLNPGRTFIYFLLFSLCLSAACGSKPTDPRTTIPADSLIYLEAADLGKVIDAVTSNASFQQASKTKPDTAALRGIKVSVAVTGFQASEEALSGENVVMNFRPRFVAVAETNLWNYQALRFADEKLGEFINDVYGGEVELATVEKHGGTYFTWTSRDGRKAYALVRGSVIFFGNDETAIENCVAVMNNGESIAKNPAVSALPPTSLASGYISSEGIAQAANIAGVSFAMGAAEEGEVKSFIARVLPEVVRNSVTDATWVSNLSENGRIEDRFTFTLAADTAKVLGETIVPAGESGADLSRFVPPEFVSTTRYSLKDAQIAWRSAVLTARTKTDQVSGGLLTAFSSSLFEPYGIEEPELFLSSVGSALQTVRFDSDGEESAVIAAIRDLDRLKQSAARELNFAKPPAKFENADIWRSEDNELAAAVLDGRIIIIGENGSVEKCLAAYRAGQTGRAADRQIPTSDAAVVTIGTDTDADARLVKAMGEPKEGHAALTQTYITETRFNQKGIERRTTSDFGLIGTLLAQVARD